MHLNIPRIPRLANLKDTEAILHTLDEQGSRALVDRLNWPDQFPYHPLTTFAAAHDGYSLYVDFLVRCNYLRAENYTDLSPVSEDSCVEIFLKPKADGEYWNFEFNCIGTANASHRLIRSQPTRLTADELARIERYPSCGKRPFCELQGLFTWNLMVKFPLDLMNINTGHGAVHISGNFYKCASRCTNPHYLSWNPIRSEHPDFHRPEFFGDITLL